MADVLVIGIAVVDFVFAVDELPKQPAKYRAQTAEVVGGGCAANAAVAISRLGGNPQLVARLGDDAIGDMIIQDLIAEGINCNLVQRTAGGRSSFSSVYVDPTGERQILNFHGEGLVKDTDWINAANPAKAVLADTRWSEGAAKALHLARNWRVPGIIDAEAPMERAVLELASHVAFSRDGLLSFSGEKDLEAGLRAVATSLPGWVCVTDGAHGTYFIEEGNFMRIPAPEVEVRDTLAAGDVWHGAFTLALAEGGSELDAIRFANVSASLKCTEFGGRKGCPNRATVEKYLKEIS